MGRNCLAGIWQKKAEQLRHRWQRLQMIRWTFAVSMLALFAQALTNLRGLDVAANVPKPYGLTFELGWRGRWGDTSGERRAARGFSRYLLS